VLWLITLVACALTAPIARASDDRLVPSRSDLPGYRAAGAGTGVARTALGGRTPSVLLRAPAQGVAFRAGSRELTIGVFSFSSSARASQALRRLASGRRRVGSGLDGFTATHQTSRSTDVTVVFHVGSALGAVRLRSRERPARAAQIAVAYAQSLGGRLRRVLALSAWQLTLDKIGSDGSITTQLALQAFAITYGPLPGVRRPTGPGGAPPSATLAMQLVARVWERLTPAQQAAIDRYLGAPHDATSSQIAHQTAPVLTPDPRYQAIADKYNAIYRTKLTGAAPVSIRVFSASQDITASGGAKAFADALPVNASGGWGVGSPAYCRVRVPPSGQRQSAQFLELVLAHETFHCFQFVLMANWRQRAAWLIEGMADWAAVTVDPVPESVGAGNLKAYLATPTTPLFARSYDAVGYWGHADEVSGSGSLWSKLPGVLGAPDDPTSYALAGGTSSSFVDTWASAVWRYAGAGEAWNQTNPYSIALATFSGLSPDLIEYDAPLASASYALAEYVVSGNPDLPLVKVEKSEGSLRAGTSKRDFGTVGSEWFCSVKCECPSGEQSSIPAHQDVGQHFALALTGGASPGAGTVSYHSADEFCKPSGFQGLQIRGQGLSVLATFISGTCAVTKGAFHATAKDGAWSIDVRIPRFGGYGKIYPLHLGSNAGFVVKGPGGPYSNAYPAPNHGPASGQIQFYPNGSKMSLGFEYAWNPSAQAAVLPLGVMACKRPKR
jgi:hypothetical protein